MHSLSRSFELLMLIRHQFSFARKQAGDSLQKNCTLIFQILKKLTAEMKLTDNK